MSSPHSAAASSPEESAVPPAPMATDDNAFPRAFGSYALLAAFAQGGMGEVFLAKSGGVAGIDRLCVLKKLRQDVTKNEEYVRRFLDELRVAAQLNHANICHIFDMGQVRDEYYLAMEYVSGVNLRKLLTRAFERAAVIDENVVLYIIHEVLEALDYAHRHRHPLTGKPLNLVHRDVSPQNVMLNYEGEIKLIDFGLADSDLKEEQTESKVVMGKVAYMSPEQARGEVVDGRTDLFAAAIIAYELLIGERFYGDMTSYEIWQVVGRGGFRPAHFGDLDPQLQEILGRALAAKKADRYASCAAFQDALAAYAKEGGRKGAQRLMRTLFERDHDAERRFLKRFASVTVPSTDALSPREGSVRPFVLDDRSRPTTLEEAAALAEAKESAHKQRKLSSSSDPSGVTRTLSVEAPVDREAPADRPLSSTDAAQDPTERVRTRSDVKVQKKNGAVSVVALESSDTRAAAAAAYPNRSRQWLVAAAALGLTLGVILFFFLRTPPGPAVTTTNPVVSPPPPDTARVDAVTVSETAPEPRVDKKPNRDAIASAAAKKAQAAEDAAAKKAAAEKLAADKAAAEKAAAEKAAADKAAADKAAAEKAAAEKAAEDALKLPVSPTSPFHYEAIRKALRGCTQVCAAPQLTLTNGKTGIVPMVERAGLLSCAQRCTR